MAFVLAEKVGFAYAEQNLFSGASFRLEPGFHGLVGANGAGKTTLARLIAGELSPTEGRLLLRPGDARVLVCEQRVDEAGPEVLAFAESDTADARRLCALLELEPELLGRWPTLSPGERKRFQLGAALAAEPDVLILDEPTNHLDGPARAIVLGALRTFRGVGLLIAHDRELLEALTRHTLRVHGGEVRLYPGAYGAARALWQAEAESREAERRARVDRRAAVAGQLVATRALEAATHKNLSTRARMRNRNDSDARTLAAQSKAERADARAGRRAAELGRKLDKASAAIPEFVVDKTLGRSVFVDYRPAPREHLARLDLPELAAGGRILIQDLRLSFRRRDRVHLAGPNGSGKTTLVERLRAELGSLADRVLYLPQELAAAEGAALLESTRALPRDERGRLLSLLAALGVDPDRLLASAQPSPGEARKLAIARGLAAHAVALVLDEPTNHLDLPSIERLEAALAAYPGALLIVSHDRRFAAACTDQIWEIRDGRLEQPSELAGTPLSWTDSPSAAD